MSEKGIRIKCSAVSEARLQELKKLASARFSRVIQSSTKNSHKCEYASISILLKDSICRIEMWDSVQDYIKLTNYDEALYDVAMALISQYPLLPVPDPEFDIKLLEPVLFCINYGDAWQAGHYSHRDNDKFIVSGHRASCVIRLSDNEMHVGSNTILPGWFIIEDNKIKWRKREVISLIIPDKKRPKGKK